MATQRATFSKLERERAKKAKAAAKRERRLDRAAASTEAGSLAVVTVPDGDLSAAELLDLIERVHAQLEAKEISFEEFEERKQELFARLPLD